MVKVMSWWPVPWPSSWTSTKGGARLPWYHMNQGFIDAMLRYDILNSIGSIGSYFWASVWESISWLWCVEWKLHFCDLWLKDVECKNVSYVLVPWFFVFLFIVYWGFPSMTSPLLPLPLLLYPSTRCPATESPKSECCLVSALNQMQPDGD